MEKTQTSEETKSHSRAADPGHHSAIEPECDVDLSKLDQGYDNAALDVSDEFHSVAEDNVPVTEL